MNARSLLLFSGICAALPASASAGFTIVNSQASVTTSDAQSALSPMLEGQFPTAQQTSMYNNAPVIPSQPVVAAPPMMNASAAAMPSGQVINGFGRDIPLSVAVRQIVPSGVQVIFDPGVDQSIPITWRGGKPWPQVLTDALRPNSLSIAQNYNGIVISAARPVVVPASMPTVIPPASANNMMMQQALSPGLSGNAVPLAPMVIPTWTAKSSDTLHQTLEAWCKKANVSLRWDSEFDYPLETDVSLTGDFETSVRTLLHGLKNATPAPIAHYYRSKAGGPGVLLVPSPSVGNGSHPDSDASAEPTSLPSSSMAPAVMAPISNTSPQS